MVHYHPNLVHVNNNPLAEEEEEVAVVHELFPAKKLNIFKLYEYQTTRTLDTIVTQTRQH
jgi:hypothetical protein